MFKLQSFGGLQISSSHTDNKKPYRALHAPIILVYLALQGKQEARQLAELFFADNADPQNSLDRALSNLKAGLHLDIDEASQGGKKGKKRKALVYFFAESQSPRNGNRELELAPEYLSTSPEPPSSDEDLARPLLYIDCLALDEALQTGDLQQIQAIYQGAFMTGVEEEILAKRRNKTGSTSPMFFDWLQEQRQDFADRVLEQVQTALENGGSGRQEAQALLAHLIDSHEVSMFSLGWLADAYPLLSPSQQESLMPRLRRVLYQRAPGYLQMLCALHMQHTPSIGRARRACQLDSVQMERLIEDYSADGWINDRQPAQTFRLIAGRDFLEVCLQQPNQRTRKYPLLARLFALTPEDEYPELFHLAWQYQEGTGSFGDMAWRKLCPALAWKVSELCRYGNFSFAQRVCEAWEQARAQREEASHEQLHFYHAYSLERQNHYQEAYKRMEPALHQHPTSIRHELLQANLRWRLGEIDSSETMEQLLEDIYARAGVSDRGVWARAEVASLHVHIAYRKGDYAACEAYARKAISAWQECNEPYREIGVRNNIACIYDQRDNPTAAEEEYRIIKEKLRSYPKLGGPLEARVYLNEIILRDRHALLPLHVVCGQYAALLDELTEQDVPDVFALTYYNYARCCQKMGQYTKAIEVFDAALPPLSSVKHKSTFGYAHGEMGCCYLALAHAEPVDAPARKHYVDKARAALLNAIDILLRENDRKGLATYQAALAQVENSEVD